MPNANSLFRQVLVPLLCTLLLAGCATSPSPEGQNQPHQVSSANDAGNHTNGSVGNGAETSPQPQQAPLKILGGVIEGFYGPPWDQADTLHMIQFLSDRGLNTFAYAPKNDPYQRAEWNQPYPPDKLSALRTLVNACLSHHVKFVYSISPGLSITYSSTADRKELVTKLNQLRTLGIHVFLLSFDDINPGLTPVDKKRYHDDLAYAQSDLANYVVQTESKLDPSFRLILVPTTYQGVTNNPYWSSLKSHLSQSVDVVWTGKYVINRTITAAQVTKVTQLIGHKLVIWDNYPVNDFTYVISKHPKLMLGPVTGRDPKIPSLVDGYLYNPMLQSRASEIPLWTGAEYLLAPTTYEPQKAATQAIEAIGGKASDALGLLVQDATSYYTENPTPQILLNDSEAFWNSKEAEASPASSALYRDFSAMARVNSRLATALPDHHLYQEIEPWSSLLAEKGEAGLLAMQLITLRAKGQPVSSVTSQLTALRSKISTNPRYIAGTATMSFVNRVLHRK